MASEVSNAFANSRNLDPYIQKKEKSWNDLIRAVKESRRLYATAVSRSPTNFQFRSYENEDNNVIQRLYFLGVSEGSRGNTLMYVDLPDTTDESNPETFSWTCLFQADNLLQGIGNFSKEEQLLRERKRLDMFGITAYEYHEASSQFVFAACNSLYVCQDDTPEIAGSVVPSKVPTDCPNVRLDPKFCPSNPNWVSFIHNSDIWVTDTKTNSERRLTFSQKGQDDHKTSGVPSFIVQEEFHRYTGYWWQPDSPEKEDAIERILYEEVDESNVMTVNILTAPSDNSQIDEFKYPRAGTTNASCSLKVIEMDRDSYGAIGTEIREKQLRHPLNTYFPWCEYIVRAGWTPNGQVWALLFDRRQSRMSLILIPLDSFVDTPTIVNSTPQDLATSGITVIYEESSLIWVKVCDLVYFFPQENPNEITFIWGSEKSGYRHLYLVTSSLVARGDSTDVAMATESTSLHWDTREDDELKPLILNEKQLTSGSWEVLPAELWVDTSEGLVYFMGLKDTVLETHLYVTSFLQPRRPERLTKPGFCHTCEINSTLTQCIVTSSSISQRVQASVYTIQHNEDGGISLVLLASILTPTADILSLHSPSLFTYQSKAGHQCHGMIFQPHNLTPGVRYPTVLFVYGGPEAQLVTNSFKAIKFLRLHTLAAEGFCVVALDGRGSSGRGLQYESWIKNRLGTVEIEDQVEGLHYIASQVDYIDLDRVAIHGWSYGGYLSLLGLAQRPDIFKVAISGAPVVQWTLYDTGYTERYMDLPHSNPDAYRLGSVLNYADRFPDEPNRLLIIHGLMDENVHIQHTMSLIETLVRHCKPYQLLIYPSERHGIRGVESNDHYKTSVLNFLHQNL